MREGTIAADHSRKLNTRPLPLPPISCSTRTQKILDADHKMAASWGRGLSGEGDGGGGGSKGQNTINGTGYPFRPSASA